MLVVNIPNKIAKVTTEPLYQWDYGQELQVLGDNFPAICQVHFCNKKTLQAITRLAVSIEGGIKVAIPDELLEEPYNIDAFIYVIEDESGNTLKLVEIPIIARQKPSELSEPTEDQQSEFDQIIATLNNKVEEAETRLDGKMTEVDDIISGKVTEVDGKIAEVDTAIAEIDTKVETAVTEKTSELEERLTDVEEKVKNNEQQAVQALDFTFVQGSLTECNGMIYNSLNLETGKVDLSDRSLYYNSSLSLGIAGELTLWLKDGSGTSGWVNIPFSCLWYGRIDEGTGDGFISHVFQHPTTQNKSLQVDIKIRFDDTIIECSEVTLRELGSATTTWTVQNVFLRHLNIYFRAKYW